MDNYVGKRIDGRYEIQEVIGVGGMAVVYKAYDTIDDRIEMLIEHGKTVDEQLQVLTNYKAAIEWKINYHREMKMQIDARRNAARIMEQQDLKN